MTSPGASLGHVWEQVATLFTDPSSNLYAALALYAVIGILFLIVLIVGVMFVLGTPEQDHAVAEPDTDSGVLAEDGAERPEVIETVPVVRHPRSRLLTASIVLAVVAAAWIATGYSTSSADSCQGCHATNPHAKAEAKSDRHAGVACVSCHEPGGLPGRYVWAVPSRVVHIAEHLAGPSGTGTYGRITRTACLSCHADAIATVTVDAARGVRMSHAEPLAASATCLDCHRLRAGVLSATGVGMNPCLRCHDSKRAPSECGTCHDKKAASAARVRRVSPAVQVVDVKCGGCHAEKTECDSCHGVRMPHSKAFMDHEHARAGAIDLWDNGGKTCGKCHTATRRPCTACHSSMLGTAHGPAIATSHRAASSGACDSCHQQRAFAPGRDFCVDLCHSSDAVEVKSR